MNYLLFRIFNRPACAFFSIARLVFFGAFIFLGSLNNCLTAQIVQSAGKNSVHHFNGSASITNNGISVIPTFSLGKPASIIELNAGGDRLTFEPQFRVSLEGQPWSFVFWWRYKLVNTDRFRLGTGVHPAVVFRETPIIRNGVEQKGLVAQRFLAGEFNMAYYPSKNIGFGPYLLYSRGLETGVVKNNVFLALNLYLTHIPITGRYYMKFFPQIYYLRMDDKGGVYVSSAVFFARQGLPFSISLIGNKKINSTIISRDFVWNISLLYNFGNKFTKI
ncbi:MAG: hypothetical protein RLZ62_2554 [Bacteroidota bacterium]|jgi:hypothetical protein